MPNPWIETPKADALSKEQLDVYSASLDKNLIINGAAGSGKTILGIHRARQLGLKNKKVLFITFTKVLTAFTKVAAKEFKTPNVTVCMLQDLTFIVFGRRFKNPEEMTDNQLAKFLREIRKYDYLIIDEGQDFGLIMYDRIFKKLGEKYSICMDRNQGIYDVEFNVRGIKSLFNPIEEIFLQFTYRNPRKILKLSIEFYKNRYRKIPSDFAGVKDSDFKIKVYNKTEGVIKLYHTANELETVTDLINNRGDNTTGVLLPTNKAVKYFSDCLIERGINNIEKKWSIGDSFWENDISFDNTKPKVLTFHSAKGIQFDNVIIPFLENDYPEGVCYTNAHKEAKAFYVAMTRTRKSLFFTKPLEHSFPYEEDLDTQFIEEVQKDEKEKLEIKDIYDFGDDLPF